MRILTDIWSLTGIVLVALILGAGITCWFTRRSRARSQSPESVEKEILYLIFSRISHRLKTATEVIRGHLHGFSDDLPKDAERWRAARAAITEETTGIYTLIERLDLMVRLGMKRHPLIVEPINVIRMLEDLMVELGPAADAKGIFLGGVVAAPERDKLYVSGDASVLREIFSNLLENSLKHNGKGTEIKAEVNQQDGHLLVRISDTGKGISPEILAGLFNKVSPEYHPRMTRGTGMGLYLCKVLVELHNGKITASSPNGKGAEFCVWLPLRRTTNHTNN
jgi:signal transduction histidine kinase